MANSKKPKMQEVKEAGTPGKRTNYQRAWREAAEELRKQEEKELSEQTRSGEMGGEEGRKEEKIEKEEMNKKERKRRSLKTMTPKKKSERVKPHFMCKVSLHQLKLAQAKRGVKSLFFLRPCEQKGEWWQHQNLPHQYQQQH